MAKADADYRSATALNRCRKEPVPDVVCYHCHQCAEKYFKAYLIALGFVPPRIHDLEDLLGLCALHDANLATHRPLAQMLNPFGVQIRYPGMSATVEEAKDAVKTVRRLRTVIRRALRSVSE